MRKSERASVVANDAAKPTDDGLGSVASGVELKNLQWQHGEAPALHHAGGTEQRWLLARRQRRALLE